MSRNSLAAIAVAPLRVLIGDAAVSFASGRGGVRRVVASDRTSQVLYGSGLHPNRLLHLDPGVIIECRSGDWFALDPAKVRVGHSGSGAREAIGELTALGLPDALAERIAHSTYSDVQFDASGAMQSHEDTYPRPLAFSVPEKIDGRWTVILSAESEDDLRRIQDWATYLDREPGSLPTWVSGARGATVLVDEKWAVRNGFTVDPPHPNQPISIAIQQGSLTLWIACPLPPDWTYLHPNGYEVLDTFGFTLEHYRRLDAGPLWRRWITHKLDRNRALLVPTRS
ncbi:hypothetical protein ACIQD2_18165 [Dietzia maris]